MNTCSACSGKGVMPCGDCGGTGINPNPDPELEVHGAEPMHGGEPCIKCSGTGETICSKCSGTGMEPGNRNAKMGMVL